MCIKKLGRDTRRDVLIQIHKKSLFFPQLSSSSSHLFLSIHDVMWFWWLMMIMMYSLFLEVVHLTIHYHEMMIISEGVSVMSLGLDWLHLTFHFSSYIFRHESDLMIIDDEPAQCLHNNFHPTYDFFHERMMIIIISFFFWKQWLHSTSGQNRNIMMMAMMIIINMMCDMTVNFRINN